MARQVRRGLFETNSSSVHAIVIAKTDSNLVKAKEEPVFTSSGTSYGWELSRIIGDDCEGKVDYLIAMLNTIQDEELTNKFLNMMCELCGTEEIIINKSSLVDHGYNGLEFVKYVLSDINILRRYIFSKNSYIVTGNDNMTEEDMDDPNSPFSILDKESGNSNVIVFCKGN